MACCMALSAFLGTVTVVMETLLSLSILPAVIKGRAVNAMHRLKVWNRWRDFELDGKASLKSHVKALKPTEEQLLVIPMPSDIIPSVKMLQNLCS